MCGICGLARFGSPLPAEEAQARIRPMLDAMHHRGPDESGFRAAGSAALGVTRLAIRALGSGTQPLVDRATGVLVACNGEIDNHRELRAWLTRRGREVTQDADVAVLPGLYLELGEAFVTRLSGMFALAVWDPRRERLVLARDRVGERSLFYTEGADGVAFASEIAALAAARAASLDPDPDALRHYLQYGVFAAPGSPLRQVRRVGPAETVVLSAAGASRSRYWRWSPAQTPRAAASPDAFDAVFRAAVERQTDVDVDYGVFLSGGLDSSLVLATAQRVRRRPGLKTYTLRFGEASYDEGDYASRIARREEAENIPVWVRAEDLPAGLAALVRHAGEPLADPAWTPTAMLARRAAEDVKMVLVGEGADELFGGYPTYLGALWADRYGRLPAPVRTALRRAVRAWPVTDRKVAVSYLLKRFVDGEGLDGLRRHLAWTSTVPPSTLARLGVAPAYPSPAREDAASLLDCVQRHDLETSLAEGLLTKADRASMTHSIELRAPFLDVAVMEYAATLPPQARVRGLETKVFLKRYATRYLPRGQVYRRKRGLSVPLAQWLRGPLHEWARAMLSADRLAGAGIDGQAALALLEEHQRRHADHARALWALIVLSEWFAWLSTCGSTSLALEPVLLRSAL